MAVIRWLHRWLGLLTGMVVCIVSLTGCVYVFQEELREWLYPQKYFIPEGDQALLPLSALKERAQQALGDSEKISRVDVYPGPDRTWVFRAVKTREDALGHWNYYTYYKRVFMNPYDGNVVEIEDSRNEFFQLVLSLHMNLLLGHRYGKPIVGYATLLFVVLAISGIVLWWPKKWKKKSVKRSLWLKWNAKWKRLNYDLHNVLGFYSLPLGLLVGWTGLVFAFPWIDTATQNLFNRFSASEVRATAVSQSVALPSEQLLDHALTYSLQKHPSADMMSIRLREKADVPLDIQIRLQRGKTSDFVWYYFEQETGRLVDVRSSATLDPGGRARSLNFDLHVGSIGGLATKWIYLLVSLIVATLPVTGFIIWWHKK